MTASDIFISHALIKQKPQNATNWTWTSYTQIKFVWKSSGVRKTKRFEVNQIRYWNCAHTKIMFILNSFRWSIQASCFVVCLCVSAPRFLPTLYRNCASQAMRKAAWAQAHLQSVRKQTKITMQWKKNGMKKQLAGKFRYIFEIVSIRWKNSKQTRNKKYRASAFFFSPCPHIIHSKINNPMNSAHIYNELTRHVIEMESSRK